jgi:hypothetical protein
VQRAAQARRVEADRQGQRPHPAPAQAELERLRVQGVHVARPAGVEDQHALVARGRGRHAHRGRQPPGGPAPREAVLGAGRLAVAVERLDAGQQDLLHRPLDRAHREALLDDAVGLGLVEAREGAAQARRGRGARAALAREGHRRGDVVGLLERRAQGLDLVEVELPVAARGAARLGEPEAPLPGAQRVRADAEHGCSGVGADRAHARCIERW